MIFTALSPNVQRDDFWLTVQTLLQPWQWQRGTAEKKLQQSLQLYFSTQTIWPVNSGRTALLTLLQHCGLQPNDEVLLQAFTCNAVANPILWAQGKPIYVDIEPATLTMSPQDLKKKITARSKVLIIQHTFGQPAAIEELLAIAKQHQLIVIEDCAHALGARHHDQLLGTFGDAAIFSFGRDKVISSVYGGAILINNQKIFSNFASIIETLPYPNIFWTAQQLIHPIITSAAKKIRPLLPLAQRLHLISLAVSALERHGKQPTYFPARLPNGLAALALQQLDKLDRFNHHRQSIAAQYQAGLTATMPWLPESIYLRFNVQVNQPRRLVTAFKQQGIILGDWYDAPIVPKPKADQESFNYRQGDCPVAESVSQQIVNLPTHIGITTKTATRIINLIKTYHSNTHGSRN